MRGVVGPLLLVRFLDSDGESLRNTGVGMPPFEDVLNNGGLATSDAAAGFLPDDMRFQIYNLRHSKTVEK